VRHKSLVPWLVALVIFGPFAAATLLYYAAPDLKWLPQLPGSRELIEPPVATPAGWLQAPPGADSGPYRWSLIYARMAACEQQCVRDLDRLRQVHGALGRDTGRVQRVFLHGGEPPAIREQSGARDGDPALVTLRLDDAPGDAVLRARGEDELRLGRVYIADPPGNLIASYPADVDQKELLRDLKRLLSVSGTN
jgi:hypothetical protein